MVHDHTTSDPEFDDTLHPDTPSKITRVIVAALLLAGAAVWIVSNMGLFNPN